MSDSLVTSMFGRRELLLGGLALAALPSHAGSHSARGPSLDLGSARERLRVFRKLQGSELDGAETFMHYSGVTFGSVEPAKLDPLYGMEGIVSVRSFGLPDGTVRWLANEIAVHTNLVTGEVLERWRNPYTDEMVDVWPLRNGPLNYAVSPSAEMTGGWRLLRPLPTGTHGFYLPAAIAGQNLIVTVDGQATRKNPLQPDAWPRESSGDVLVYSEHNTWIARHADLANSKVHSPEVTGAWHSLKPWRHWMLMGNAPGHIYNHLVARKIASPDEAPRAVLEYVKRAFPQFLGAPVEWTGAYRDDWSYFKEQRKPAPPRGRAT